MSKLRSTIEQEVLSVKIPTYLLDRVRIALLNPSTGIVRYGAMRKAVIGALVLWLRSKEK